MQVCESERQRHTSYYGGGSPTQDDAVTDIAQTHLSTDGPAAAGPLLEVECENEN